MTDVSPNTIEVTPESPVETPRELKPSVFDEDDEEIPIVDAPVPFTPESTPEKVGSSADITPEDPQAEEEIEEIETAPAQAPDYLKLKADVDRLQKILTAQNQQAPSAAAPEVRFYK